MNRRATTTWIGAAVTAIGAAALPALGQSSTTDPAQTTAPRKATPVRKPVVDLEAMAKERRPGQVMPGDPAPYKAAPPAVDSAPSAAPAPGAAAGATDVAAPVMAADAGMHGAGADITLPNTAPYNKPVLRPSHDGSVREMNTRPVDVPGPTLGMDDVRPLENAPMAAKDVGQTNVIAARPEIAGVPLVDGSVASIAPASMGSAPARVQVQSMTGEASGVQWRPRGEAWRTPGQGDTLEAIVEVRAGLDAELVLVVDDCVQVRISRLGRAVIERALESGGAATVSVTVARGAAEVRLVGQAPVGTPSNVFARIRTPDQNFGLVGPLRVEYDAFTGTRRRVVNP